MIIADQIKKLAKFERFIRKCASRSPYVFKEENVLALLAFNQLIEEAKALCADQPAPCRQYVYFRRVGDMFGNALMEISKGSTPLPSEDEEYMITLRSEDADNIEMNGKDPSLEANMLEYVRKRFDILADGNYETVVID